MKRSLFLATYVLLSTSNNHYLAAEPCIIHDPMLPMIDKIFNRLHRDYNISHVILLTTITQEFIDEIFNHTSQKQVSLTAMVALENSLPDKKKLQKFTERCIKNFVVAIQKHHLLELFSSLQEHYRALVLTWATQRDRTTSPFVRFSMTWRELGTELQIMQNTVTTLAEYQQFLQDLHTFLEDLTASLPNAYSEYQECAQTNTRPNYR